MNTTQIYSVMQTPNELQDDENDNKYNNINSDSKESLSADGSQKML